MVGLDLTRWATRLALIALLLTSAASLLPSGHAETLVSYATPALPTNHDHSHSTVWIPKAFAGGCTDSKGCGFVISGSKADSSTTSTNIMLYDPAAGTMTTNSVLPFPTFANAAIYDTYDHMIYIFGGVKAGGVTWDIVRYNPATPATPAVDLTAHLNVAINWESAVWDPTVSAACPHGCAYIFGGDNGGAVATIQRFEPIGGGVTNVGNLPAGRWGTSAVWSTVTNTNCPAGCAYIFAGYSGSDRVTDIVRFSPSSPTTSSVVANFPTKRQETAAAWSGSAAYVFGGDSGGTDEIRKFDPVTETQSLMSCRLITPRRYFSAAWSNGAAAYIIGGDASSDDIQEYNPNGAGCGGSVIILSTAYCVGSRVQFRGSFPPGHTAKNGTWTWGDSQSTTVDPWSSPTTHAYSSAGTYNVTLTVTYTDGTTGTMWTLITISACPPPIITGSLIVCLGGHATLTGTAPAGYTASNGTWTWGDGNSTTSDPWSSTATHKYNETGNYTVTLQMRNNDGSTSGTASVTVTVKVCPPPSFTYAHRLCAWQSVSFTLDAPENHTIATANWTWGDGSPNTAYQSPNAGSASHNFPADGGTFNVTVTVTYEDGSSYTITQTVTIDGCKRTWAAGDKPIGPGLLFVVGDDPGCGLGDADSSKPGHPRSFLVFTPPGLPMMQPDAPQDISLAAGMMVPPRNSLFIAGGTHGCGFAPSPTNWAFDFATGWRPDAPLLKARIAPAAAVAGGGQKPYIAGGDATGGTPLNPLTDHIPTATAEKYVMGPNAWAWLPPMPAGVIGAAAYTNNEDHFFVTGGYSHPQAVNQLIQEYNVISNQWEGPHLPRFLTAETGAACNSMRWVAGGMEFTPDGMNVPMHDVNFGLITDKILRKDASWTAAGNLPIPLAYHSSTVTTDFPGGAPVTYIYGGYTPAGTGPISNALIKVTCPTGGSAVSTQIGPPSPPPPPLPAPPPPPKIAEAALGAYAPKGLLGAAGAPQLYLFGGTDTVAGCPLDTIYVINTANGGAVQLSTPLPSNPLVKSVVKLPVAVASMGYTQLADGRIVMAGGRISGTNAAGAATCYVPTDRVFVFDPATNGLCEASKLPVGLTAPAMSAVGTVVYVAGGDDRGDVPTPTLATDPRIRHPAHEMYSMDLGAASNCVGTQWAPAWSGTWSDVGEMPMGVVHAPMIALGSDLWVVGGNQHAKAAVRLVQTFNGGWSTTHLPEALAHHAVENCIGGPPKYWGGIHAGTVYHSEPTLTTYSTHPEQRAFAVGGSPWVTSQPTIFATGTTPTSHRMNDAWAPGC